jgi:phage shock protein PspC (stress-responsive transcriptional regulator)
LAKKRLSRAKSNKVIAGVFSGLANYLETEVTFLRISPFIITVLVYLFFGSEAMFGVILAILILYTGYWIALPEEDN